MRVLVTGGTGFLGRHVARQLIGAGHDVAVLTRPMNGGGNQTTTDTGHLAADVCDARSLREVVKEFEVVCHAAGIPRSVRPSPRREAAMQAVNAEGTRNVCRAAAEAGVKRVVVISSITVYGTGRKRPFVEGDDCRPADTYAQSKLRAEEFAAAASVEFGLGVTVLRLGPLYGPGHAGNVRRLLEAIERRRFYPIGRGGNRKSLLHVLDAAIACRLAVEWDPENRERFSIFNAAGPPVTVREIVRAAAEALGRRPYRGCFPALPFDLLSRAGICPRAIERWLADEAVDSTRFSREFDWRPEVGLGEGFRREAADLRHCFGQTLSARWVIR